MTILVGVSPDEAGADAVALGAVLSSLIGESLTLAHVHPPTIDYPSMGNVDAEWAAFLRERSLATLRAARQQLASDWGISPETEVISAHSSVSRGLLKVAQEVQATFIVVGPGPGGRDGHLSLGSTAHSLLHGGDVGVGLAPEGYRETAPDRLDRLVVGFRTGEQGDRVAQWAQKMSARTRVGVELFTAVIRATRIVGARLGRDPERAVMQALCEQGEEAQRMTIQKLGDGLSGFVAQGDTAAQAMGGFPWRNGDLFVLGSSSFGTIRKVFLGDTSLKLLRAATVPALVLPRED